MTLPDLLAQDLLNYYKDLVHGSVQAKALWQEHRSNKEYLVSEGYLAGEDPKPSETVSDLVRLAAGRWPGPSEDRDLDA